jgi:hypothetical protein
MTDQAQAGSGAADAQQTGTPASQQSQADNGSAAGADTTPFSGLSEGTRKWVDTKGYKSLEDVAAAGMSMEQKFGSMISLPDEKAKPEEWDEKVFSRLPEGMRPVKDAAKIEYKRPEGLPADLPYSDDIANASKQWAVEAGVSPKAAQVYHDKVMGLAAEQFKEQQAKVAKSVEDTHDALVKEWGPLDSEGFKTKHAMANRALTKLGLADAFKGKGIILPDGALTDPQIAKAFSAIGEAMFKEDTILENGGASGGENPFKRDVKGSIVSPTAISALIKSDPERAKRMAREAGERYEDWVPSNPQ